jgi:phenylpropionate dioxygenase-like ring-hydroxylating dioxygenase large terminal subunit
MNDLAWLMNAWYVAMLSADLEAGKIYKRTILNEGMVIYRTDHGHLVALEDKCPHRYAPLSMGKLCGDNRIACAYHGLQFDATGACVYNPHGNGRIPPAAKVKSYLVEEKYGMIWVWMGDADNVTETPTIDFLEPGTGYKLNKPAYLHMATPWQLIIDNLVDLSHVSFLHDGLLGGADMIGTRNQLVQSGNTITVSRTMPNVRPPEYSDLIFHADGRPVDKQHVVKWIAPSIILLDINVTSPGASRDEGTGVYAAHLITPETEATSFYHFAAARWGLIERSPQEEEEIEARLAAARRKAFAEQDEPMMRAQYEVIKRYGGEFKPAMLDIDVGVVRWRRILADLVAKELA